MRTRYTLLRKAVANLAAPADAQVAYLDAIFKGLTCDRSAEGYGNCELALEFDDSFIAIGPMFECGEINLEEIDALRSIDGMLSRWSGQTHQDFWKRKALYDDPRWQAIRIRASEVLALLPIEKRESEYTRGLTIERSGS